MRPRSLVVVGTGTEVGKTWVSARLLECWRSRGALVGARKPAQSFAPGDSVLDADVLALASGEAADDVCPPERSFAVPLAPPMAAARLGLPLFSMADLIAEMYWPPGLDVGLVEAAGGLRSPQAADGDGVDMCTALDPDSVVLVADAGLGTINGVRLCVDTLAAQLRRTLVVLNRFDDGQELHHDNLAWLRHRDGFDVTTSTPHGLAHLADRLLHPAS